MSSYFLLIAGSLTATTTVTNIMITLISNILRFIYLHNKYNYNE